MFVWVWFLWTFSLLLWIFLEEAIVLQGERGFEFLTLWIMVFGFEAVNGG